MRKVTFVVVGALALGWSAAWLVGCGDDTEVEPPDSGTDATTPVDAGGFETAPFDGIAAFDAAVDAPDAEAAAPSPARLLLSYDGTKGLSELAVFDLATGVVDGRLLYPSAYGTTAETATSPWLLEQKTDVVARLEALQPWVVQSSWSVALHDVIDGGYPYSDPNAVIAAGATAYVLRYDRNEIAVLDSTEDVDGGAPSSTIDLSSQLQKGGDGTVEMSAGWYDGQKYVYVLLANINQNLVEEKPPYAQLCSPTHPTVVAIDATTGKVAPVGDAGAGFALTGYGAAFNTASPMVYDAPNGRLLVLETGCYETDKDGGLGKLVGRQIEALSIPGGATTVLATLTDDQTPSSIFYVDPTHVIVQTLDSSYKEVTYMWDPSSSKLGAVIPGAPDGFAVDGQGNLVGVTKGKAGWSVISVNPTDGGTATLGAQDPFYADAGDGGDLFAAGFLAGVQLWPAN